MPYKKVIDMILEDVDGYLKIDIESSSEELSNVMFNYIYQIIQDAGATELWRGFE